MEEQHLRRELSSDIELPECLTAIATIQKARSIRCALVANVRPKEGVTPMQLFFLECRSRYLRQQLQATQRKYSRPAMLSSKEEALDIIEVHRHFSAKRRQCTMHSSLKPWKSQRQRGWRASFRMADREHGPFLTLFAQDGRGY